MRKGIEQVGAYPDIKVLLSVLRSEVQSVLGKQLIGLYIHGSLASGDFNLLRSDIDILVITSEELAQPTIDELIALHGRIASSGLKWATKLECSYIHQGAIRRYDPAHTHHPSLRVDGSFDIDHHGKEWIILRSLIRKDAIALTGPDPAQLIDPISSEDLKHAALGTLEDWWAPQIKNPSRLDSDEYRAYTILTMCRILYTLHSESPRGKPRGFRGKALQFYFASLSPRFVQGRFQGKSQPRYDAAICWARWSIPPRRKQRGSLGFSHGSITSKSEAVAWAKARLDDTWTQIIENAYCWPQSSELADTQTAQALIKYRVKEAISLGLQPKNISL